MKINHHVSFKVDEEQKAGLSEIGIDVQTCAWQMFAWPSKDDITFDIAEDDERWEVVHALFRTWSGDSARNLSLFGFSPCSGLWLSRV